MQDIHQQQGPVQWLKTGILIYSTLHSLAQAESSFEKEPETVTLEPMVVDAEADETFSYTVFDAKSATKTDTPIMEIPQSIQVIPIAILRDQDLQTLSGAIENVSSVVAPKSTELLTSEFIVRGFKSQFYVDSLPVYGRANAADPLSLINVERIEVVKGPTSTLFGGGLGAPVGGLINVVSKQPLPKAQYHVNFRGGSYNTLNPSFDFNQPLTEDKTILFRVTGEYEQSESYIDVLKNEQYSIFPTLAFNFSPETQLVIRGQYSHVKFLEYAGLRAEGTIANAPYRIPSHRYSGATNTPKSKVENSMVTAELSHRFSDFLQASIQARYYENNSQEYSSFHYPSLNLGNFGQPSPSHLPFFSGNLPFSVKEFVINPNFVLDFKTGFIAHKVLFGAEYDTTHTKAKLGTRLDDQEDIYLDVANRYDDIAYLDIVEGNFIASQDDHYQTIGVYLQDQMDITSRFHLLTSLRWTRIIIDESGFKTKHSNITPRVGAVFDVTDTFSIFAGYGEGFRAVTALFGSTPKPEESQQVEAGVKFDFYQIGLSGSVAGYRLIRKNVVVPNPEGAFSSIQAGEQMSYGTEVDFLWEPSASLSILGNYAYTEAKLTEHPDATLGLGDRLPRVPRHSGRVAIHYRFMEGFFKDLGVGMGITAMSNRHLSLPNQYKVGGFYRIDAQAAYPLTEHISVALNVQNLSNTQYYEPFLFLEDEVVAPGAPISAFVTMTAQF